MIPHRDPLTKLSEFMLIQTIPQFGLAHQNNLEKFAVVGFKIGEQSHLFQQIVGQILRLIDDKNRLAVLRHLFQKKMIYLGDGFEAIKPFDLQTEFHGNGLNELAGIESGIDNQRGGKILSKLVEQRAAERGFARADFAGKLHKPFSLANSVKQMVERLAMFGAVKKKSRIGSDVKRRFRQAVIFQIHGDGVAETGG